MPDLMFMDIHLADGSSFAIFDRVDITCLVIFTTAYDEYALKAFEVNSIDYLLKPISKDALARAMRKYHLVDQRLQIITATMMPCLSNLQERNATSVAFCFPSATS